MSSEQSMTEPPWSLRHRTLGTMFVPLSEAFRVGEDSSAYPIPPAPGPAPALKAAENRSPAGFLPPPPSAPATVGATLSGVKMRACCVSHVFSDEGLLFHSRLRSEGAGYVVEVPHLVPLVGGESYGPRLRLGDEGLHLHILRPHQSAGESVQIDTLISLVDVV